MKERILHNLQTVRDNIKRACDRARRNPEEVRLVAVTKSVDVDAISVLLEAGQADLGESRVQALIQRSEVIRESMTRRLEPPDIANMNTPKPVKPVWHMIGHLQRNKVKNLLPVVNFIHSVDSLRLAEEINTMAAKLGLNHKIPILLQVNTSREKQKYGLAVGAVTVLAEQIETLPNILVSGLMTMAPLTDNQEICRFCFGRLREIFLEIRGEKICGPHFQHLSMGMSQDYMTAIEEGATMIRVGTALFQ